VDLSVAAGRISRTSLADVSKTGVSFAIAAATVGISATGVARPALAADASNGKRLAELSCAACHVVTVNQRQANADAPPFGEIAKRLNFSEPGLATFLLDLTPRCRT
jgi:cytochrome c2